MNTYNVNKAKSAQRLNYIELAAYIILASGLIGHIFFLEGPVGAGNIMLITAGIVFGVMASLGWTPLTAQLYGPTAPWAAKVFKLGENRNRNKQAHDIGQRHAA